MATLTPVLLGYKKDFPKDSTETKGDEVSVTGNVILLIPDDVVGHFNIPEAPANVYGGVARQVIAQYTYKRYKDFTDSTGVDVIVPAHERGVSGKESAENVVRLPHATLKTAAGRPRTCSIRFPRFFNLIMISQALGSMIKANEPASFKLDSTGKSHPFVQNTSTTVFTGYESGAWVATTLMTPVNTEETDVVADITIVKGRTRNYTAAPTP